MHHRTKLLLKIWIKRLFYLIILSLIVWANINRLRDNSYSNYEKVIDFGRIKDEDKLVKPIIAAIFYNGKNTRKNTISTYLAHTDNYKKQNIQMIIVPKKISSYSAEVVEKLYEAIKQNNSFQRVLLVYDKDAKNDIKQHKKMLQQIINVTNITENPISQQTLTSENKIEEYLNTPQTLVIFLADLDKGLNEENSEFLTAEAAFFAQKHKYQINVFDIIDTQLAQTLDKDYSALYPLETIKEEPVLAKQKRNLQRYKKHYWHLLQNYFELNLLKTAQGFDDTVMPIRSEENYRLYDRGRLILKAYDENYIEIFEQAEMQENKGIAALVSDTVKKLAAAGKIAKAKYFKLYLLTDFEAIKQQPDTMLMSHLDEDDGLYGEYKGKSAILVADDRPDNPEDLAPTLRQKAKIPDLVPEKDIKFYRFKTVEMKYGD